MRYLRDAEDLPSFFRRLRTADRRVLLLDYDGTLAPFRTDRNQAVPYPGVREVLADIISQHSTRVVIISGRAVADVSRLIGLSPLPEIWGSHGWEHLTVDGAYTLFPLDPASQGKLGEARDRLDRLGLSQHREDKPVSVAVHWRGLPTHDAEFVRWCPMRGPRWPPDPDWNSTHSTAVWNSARGVGTRETWSERCSPRKAMAHLSPPPSSGTI